MLNYKKYIIFFLFCLFAFVLVSCGVKGKLKLPEDEKSQRNTVRMN